jgi:tetratricopeptide (TPR) repeat protein
MRDYEAARELHPEFGAIYVNRGNIFFVRGTYDSAIVEYTRALDAEMSDYQVAHLNRGMAHESLGHYPDAEADYRRALALAPNWPLAETKLARVLGKMN